MKIKNIILKCKRVKFFGPDDKDTFFEWIKKNKKIVNFKGVGDIILLSVATNKITDEELSDFFALFRRYKINTKQLEVFLNERNKDIFDELKYGYSICVYPKTD